MSFVSFEFALLLPFLLLAAAKLDGIWRQIFFVISGFFFVAWLSIDYALIMAWVTVAAWFGGVTLKRLGKTPLASRLLLTLAIVATAGPLFYFKYFDFLSCVVGTATNACAVASYTPVESLILPLGISFYTLHALGYLIDVYRNRQTTEPSLISFAAFIAYFPQLVAGPIARSDNLLPQVKTKRTASQDEIDSGVRLIIWGVFKKVVIADQLTQLVDPVYAAPGSFGGVVLLIATIAFAIQIYCDFSGYTDIAIGLARLMGIKLITNFNRPYMATTIQEFWRRWHMSLSTWFRDYLYKPLGGSRHGTGATMRNLMIVFVVSGLWHGANWTFLIWGFLHGLYMVVHLGAVTLREKNPGLVPRLPTLLAWFITVGLVTLAWVFFRAPSVIDALVVLRGIVLHAPLEVLTGLAAINIDQTMSVLQAPGNQPALIGFTAAALMFYLEFRKDDRERLVPTLAANRSVDFSLYLVLVLATLAFGEFGRSAFIYFQF